MSSGASIAMPRMRISIFSDARRVFAIAGTVLLLASCGPRNDAVKIDVNLILTDENGRPVAGWPLRVVAGIRDWNDGDWQAPDAGVRIITDKEGRASFTTEGAVTRQWKWVPVGFMPLSWPVRVSHAGFGFETERVLPSKHGDVTHHWFYTADLYRYSDGATSTYDIDRVYDAGADKRFSRLIGAGVASPNGRTMVDGLEMSGSAYRLADFTLDPVGDGAKEWQMALTLKQTPKAVLR